MASEQWVLTWFWSGLPKVKVEAEAVFTSLSHAADVILRSFETASWLFGLLMELPASLIFIARLLQFSSDCSANAAGRFCHFPSLPPSPLKGHREKRTSMNLLACLTARRRHWKLRWINEWMRLEFMKKEEREISAFDIGPATTVSTVWPFQFHANYESYTALPAAEGSFVLSFDLNRDEAVTTGEEIDGRRRTESRRDDTPSKAASIQGWMVARCKTYFRYVHRWRSITPSAAEWCQPELPKHSCCLMTRFRRFSLGCS